MLGVIVRQAKWKKLREIGNLIGKYEHGIINLELAELKNVQYDFLIQNGVKKPSRPTEDIYIALEKLNKPILIREAPNLRMIDDGSSCRAIPFDSKWFKFSWNHYFLDEGIYPYDNTYDRWTQLSKEYNINVHDWKRRGDNILLNCQKPGDSALNKLTYNNINYKDYIVNVINKIKKVSDRPLIIRPHPKDNTLRLHLDTIFDNLTYSNKTLYEELDNAWCAITYNSTSSVETSLYGTPTIVLDPSAASTPVSQTEIEHIENTWEPCREQWLKRIAFMQWEGKELRDGYVWDLLKSVMPNHGPKIN